MLLEFVVKTLFWSAIVTFSFMLYKVSGFWGAIWAFIIGFAIIDILKWLYHNAPEYTHLYRRVVNGTPS
jgi:sterol desaturase/sphingolipid hydroxylase (fatty acid hydroxylase superfamily)